MNNQRDSWGLVAAAQAGDREAFGQLYLRYQSMVERFVSGRVSDWAAAQDLTSETFARAWRRIDSVSDQGQGRDVGAWLTTIARNLVSNRAASARQRCEQPAAVLPEPRAGIGREVVTPEEEVLAGLDRVEAGRVVARGVAGLSPVQRHCIELRDLQGCSIAETAAVMGRTPGAVKTLHHRARARLTRELRDTEQANTWHGRDAVRQATAWRLRELDRDLRRARAVDTAAGPPGPPVARRADATAKGDGSDRVIEDFSPTTDTDAVTERARQAVRRVREHAAVQAREPARVERLARWHAADDEGALVESDDQLQEVRR
jgi:RNA polymerase sigma-70 factor (ECF subfamily)